MSDLIAAELRSLLDDPLTQIEREILPRLLAGLSNAQIAQARGVAVGTIKSHVTRLIAKFQVTSRAEVVYLALLLEVVALDADKDAAVTRLRERVPRRDGGKAE